MPGVTFTHGFDGCNTTTDLGAGGVTYVQGPATFAASTRFSTNNQKCIRMSDCNIGRTIDAPVERIITGVAIEYDNFKVAPFIYFYDVTPDIANRNQVIVSFDTTNNICRAYRATSNPAVSVLLGSSEANITNSGVWFYLEIDVTIHSSAGAILVRMNGTTDIIGLTGLNTQRTENANCQGVAIGMHPTTGEFNNSGSFDDWYIIEPIGAPGTENSFRGNVQIYTVFPNAAGAHTDFTPLSGTNFSQVNETAVNGDTSYNHSDTPGAIDSFEVVPLPTNMVPSLVNIKTTAKQDNAGDHTLANLLISDGTESLGDDLGTFQGGYRQQNTIYHVDPNGDIPWTNAAVTAMEIGYKLVA